MTYPGDATLSPEIQQRILTTYRQTLQLASQGKREEALLGCDFILRLDSQFAPARSLQERVHAGDPPESFFDLLEAVPEPAKPAGAPADLAGRLGELLEARRFQELFALAEGSRGAIVADPALRQLVETARARAEAEPYVLGFVDPARQALQSGEYDEFERLMSKARSLDASHPALAELEEARAHYQDPERVLGNRRQAAPPSPAGGGQFAADADLELPELDFGEAPSAGADGFELGGAEPEGGGAGGGEGVGRIAELLREGEGAFNRGEYQAAIDAWSRIFLIDIDHQEAARRIEQARQLKAEREREVEEHFHDAVERFDRGEYDAAREGFDRVLSMHPGYVLAQEYLEKIEERLQGGLAPAAVPEPAATDAAPPPPAAPRVAAREELSEEILVPPEPGQAPAPRRGAAPSGVAVAAKRKGGLSPRFLVIGGAVLALLAAAGWFVTSRWDQLFPNAKAVATPAPAQVDAIAKAKQLHEEGKTAVAIAQLRRIPPDDPRYGEAQSLVSQWEAIQEKSGDEPALSPAQALKRRGLIDRARTAAADQQNVRARSLLERAGEIAPLAGEEAELAASIQEHLAPFADEMKLYHDGEYEFLLNALWRRREAEKGDRDLDQLIVDAYFNLAVLELQRGDPASAADKLREARKLDASDPRLERLERFALAYERKSQDLLYRIFVKYLQVR
ncbi:MAG: hypothetical protein H6511_04230 [Holophagales bacterium]|nr:hypothetical protein [Holophagales bacterium]